MPSMSSQSSLALSSLKMEGILHMGRSCLIEPWLFMCRIFRFSNFLFWCFYFEISAEVFRILEQMHHFRSAILEMDSREQASTVETQLRDYLFMIGGMPRPARARRAEPVMLVDHPCNRKRKCEVKLISRSDPNKGSIYLKRSKVEQQAAEACVLYEVSINFSFLTYG